MPRAAPQLLAVTLGDPNGIGPDVALRALHAPGLPRGARWVLVGAPELAAAAARSQGLPPPPVWDGDPARPPRARVSVWQPPEAPPAPPRRPGRLDPRAAAAAAGWVRAAARGCLDGRFDGLVTAPLNKEGLARAGLKYPGHTELLAAEAAVDDFGMLLLAPPLRVMLVTRHLPLRAVPRAVTGPAVRRAVCLAAAALPWLGVPGGTIAVCGLNPHAGDGGALGDEDRRVIAPAVRALRARGLRVAGPLAADTVFHAAARGRYAAVVAMYHDQGLGPLKLFGFERGVNLTLGLPFVRTSPDHGTAYDLAGTHRADPASMRAALRLAADLARRPNPWARARR